MTINVMYCGMAHDIMLPLLLIPDLDNLFVIDNFDWCYSPDGTIDGQRNTIIQILENGNNYNTQSYHIYNENLNENWDKNCNYILDDDNYHIRKLSVKKFSPVHYLQDKATIVDD